MESLLAVRSDSGKEVDIGGSPMGGSPRSTFGVTGYSDSMVNMEGEGVSTSGAPSYSSSRVEAVVVTEAMVSNDVRLRSCG